ncbi:hypothetical protein BH09PLA1_BH09PLA1_06380 [soil metagenome]
MLSRAAQTLAKSDGTCNNGARRISGKGYSGMSQTRLAVLLFTDIVGSTELKSNIGTAEYAKLLARHNDLFETGLRECAGAEIVKHTGDGYFVTLPTASDAVRFALRFQTRMKLEPWQPQAIATRVGIHIGEVQLMDMAGRADVLGLSADIAARIMSLATGGQILLTASAFNDARQFVNASPEALQDTPPLKWIAHGPYLFKGSDEPLDVFEVGLENFSPLVRPPDSEKVKRIVPHDQEPTLGWRPAVGLDIPSRPGWTLERKIGDGGFGEVWLGSHAKLKERRVFKFCFDADRLRSFKRELTLFRLLREALGDRADIATLYEVKLDEAPFFLESEYTEGGNLLDWAERKGGIDKIPMNDRLELLAKIADAVAAAHSVGILHKDIKPSNILMQENADGTAHPVLADFGIGILSDRSQLEARAITETGFTVLTQNDSSRTGTRMYSPPESLLNKPFTTQGDVYALGVLLYQITIADLLRPLAAGWERNVPNELLRQDIAQMVEGDSTQRIATATEVATRIRTLESRWREAQRQRDLARTLARRKHRARLALGAAATLALLLMIGGTTALFYIRSIRAEQDRTKAALFEAERQEKEAKTQSEIATAVSEFLTERVLAGASPENLPDKKVRDAIVKAMLDPAAAAVTEDFKDKPLVEAAVRISIALSYISIGRADLGVHHAQTALALRRRVLGDDHPDTLQSIGDMGYLLQAQGKLSEAEPLYREALERYRRVLGDDHPGTLISISNMGALLQAEGKLSEAEPVLREALERSRRVLGHDRLGTLDSINNMGSLLQEQGKLSEAEPLWREALEGYRRVLGDDHPRTLNSINNMGRLLQGQSKLSEAELLLREALERRRRVLGDDHPDTLGSINNMGLLLQTQGKLSEAEPLLREAVERYRRVLGDDHPSTLISISNMGLLLQAQGKLSEAEPLWREALERSRRVLGDDHPSTLISISNMGFLLQAQGKLSEAEPLIHEALTKAKTNPSLGSKHPYTKRFAANYAKCLDAMGRRDEAAALRKEFGLADPATQPVTQPVTKPAGAATQPS